MDSNTINPSAAEEVMSAVEKSGYWFGSSFSPEQVPPLINSIGKKIYVTDVTVKPDSKALVTSDRALDFHTDHHRADLILWHCIHQSDQGGESIMLDAYDLLARLSSGQRELLKKTMLFEHKVFPDDPEQFPVLSSRLGRDKIYYSFWLQKDKLLPDQRDAFFAFKRLTETSEPITILLKPSDVLIMDNGRLLHGRKAIMGNKNRLLKRYWIER